MPIPSSSTGADDPDPASVDAHPISADLADHLHQVQDWLNGGALPWIRLAEPPDRVAMLNELAAVLGTAAVSAANAASACREANSDG